MDRKSILVLVACFGLMVLWSAVLVPKLYPPKPVPYTNAPAARGSNLTAAATSTVAVAEAPVAPPTLSTPAAPAAPFVAPAVKETTLVLANDNARYTFTSHGGGLKEIELVRYRESVAQGRQAATSTNFVTLNHDAPVPMLAILGDASIQGDNLFTLTRTASGVRAEKSLPNGLVIVKDFTPTSNYLVAASVRLENRGAQTLALPAQEWVIGTATPLDPTDVGTAVGVMWYNGVKEQQVLKAWFDNATLGCIPGTPRVEYRGGSNDVRWVTAHNQFFALAAMLPTNGPEIVVRPVGLPQPTAEQIAANSRIVRAPGGFQAAFAEPAVKLAPGAALQRNLTFFAGPKEYRTLAGIASQQNNNIDLAMGFGGFFGFFAKLLLLSMNWLQDTFHFGYGLAIIAITVIIKLLFWPLTQASTRSMKRMQALQPQMKAIQEKYKADPAKMNKKTMEFMKEHKVSPLGGCLPMLLQIPVFFGFYTMIQSAIELRGERFLWVKDLAQPDTLFMIPGFNFPFNLLPLIMGGTMLWQSHLTPPSPGMDPTQQKIMKYLPLMFLFMLYNFSSGLTLYWTVQNILTIAQMKLTKSTDNPAAVPALAAAAAPTKSAKRK